MVSSSSRTAVGLANQAQWIRQRLLLQFLSGIVGAAIVDHHNLVWEQGLLRQLLQAAQ